MKTAYRKYYEKLSPWAPFVFLKDAFLSRSSLRKLSLTNRQRDYARLSSDARRLALHRELNDRLAASHEHWSSYDYGEGYFYQSCRALGITGLRDTEARVAAMELPRRLAGKTVLEIGCNAGFLAVTIAEHARRVVGFDLNPHLIDIARLAAEHLGRSDCEFTVSAFEHFPCDRTHDVVLSFANHSTYDGNTRQSIADYFDRCHALITPGGQLLFESHPPAHEGAGLEDVLRLIGERFVIEERRILDTGSFLDRGRTFVVARRPATDS